MWSPCVLLVLQRPSPAAGAAGKGGAVYRKHNYRDNHRVNATRTVKRQLLFLPAATKLGQGNIFTSVCLSTGERGKGCLPQCMLGYTPPGADPLEQIPPGADTPWEQTLPPEQTPREAESSIRSTSGWYASYWNAFLFLNLIQSKIKKRIF